MPLCWWGESLDGGRFEAISKIPPRDFLLGWSCPAHRFPPALLHLMIANYADYMGPDCANTQRDACRVAMLLANCHFSCSPNQWAEWTWLKGLSPPSPPACAPRTSHGIGITVIAHAFLAPSAKLHTFNWKTQSSEQGCVKKQQGVFFLDPLKASATDLQCLLGVVPLVTASSPAICRPRLINTSKWDGECHNIQCCQNSGFWNSQLQGSAQMFVWFVKICPEI